MKFILKYITIIGFLFIISCSTDDDGNPNRMAGADNQTPNNLPQGNNRLNLRITGDSANELLSDRVYKSLTIEFVGVEGTEASQQAIDNLNTFIQIRCHKPNGIRLINKTIPKPEDEDDKYTIQEIARLENLHRTAFSEGDDIAVYIFFADRENENSTETNVVLGTAYRNTSIVVYDATLRRLTRRANDAFPNVKAATLIHEFCHILGLVNIGTPMVENHEAFEENNNGEEVGGHCNVEGCLMSAQANFRRNIFGQVEIAELDPLCIQDLQANGGK